MNILIGSSFIRGAGIEQCAASLRALPQLNFPDTDFGRSCQNYANAYPNMVADLISQETKLNEHEFAAKISQARDTLYKQLLPEETCPDIFLR